MVNILYIVTPVFEDTEAATILLDKLKIELSSGFQLIMVDDGSLGSVLSEDHLSKRNISGVILRLKRNVGHQMAIAIGLGYVNSICTEESTVVVMDSDGEDRPETISMLVKHLIESDNDVIVSGRRRRIESLRFKIFYGIYRQVFKVLSGKSINFGNFMAMNKRALCRLVSMPELQVHVAACVLRSRLIYSAVSIDRGERYAGRSKMNFPSLVLHGFSAVMVFADTVLVRIGVFASVLAGTTVLMALVATGLKLAGLASEGWFSVTLGILGVFFLQAFALGMLAIVALMLTGNNVASKADTLIFQNFISRVDKA